MPSTPNKVYRMEYRIIGYTLADGMRPVPGWGKKAYFIKEADLGYSVTEAELFEAADHPENTPEGYKLFSVKEVK